MIFKFYQLYRSLKEVLGEQKANIIFPEYKTLPDKMSSTEQADLAREIMNRLDDSFDKETIIAIRMKHPCGIPNLDKQKIIDIKDNTHELDERIRLYNEYLNGSYNHISENTYIFSWGIRSCVCGMFRKLKDYEFISPTWCQCCNGNNKLQLEFLLDKEIKSELIEGICSGGKECTFKITI